MRLPALGAAVGALLLFFAASAVVAQEVSVDYLDGRLSIEAGTEWTDLFMGAKVPASARLLLGEASVAELDAGGLRILLSRAGAIDLADVLQRARSNPASNMFSRVGTTIGSIIDTDQIASFGGTTSGVRSRQGPGTVSGVRSFEKSMPAPEDLFPEEPGASDAATAEFAKPDPVQNAMTLLAKKEFLRAAAAFASLARDSSGMQHERFVYLEAYSHAVSGELPAALKLLLSIPDDTELVGDAGYVLFRGSLLMQSLRWNDALALFAAHEQKLDGGSPIPAVQNLIDLCREAISH